MSESSIKSLYKTLKLKRKNAIFSKNILIYEKRRIRSMEMSYPLSDMINTLEEIGYFHLIKQLPNFNNVIEKSETDHYLLGRITLEDKKEYYYFLDQVLSVFRIERDKNN